MGRHIFTLARAIATLTAMTALVVGWPIALAVAVGWPLPTSIPTLEQLADAARSGIDDTVLINSLAVVGWLAWAQIVVALTLEAVAAARGRSTPRLPFLSAGAQRAAAHLIAGVILTGHLTTTPTALAAPTPGTLPVAAPHSQPATTLDTATTTPSAKAAAAPDRESVEDPPAETTSAAESAEVAHPVERHDTYWDIAEWFLGDGAAWRQIRDLNVGRTMPDGRQITADSETLQPGWLLLLPPTVDPDTPGLVPASDTHAFNRHVDTVVAERGDHLWALAAEALETTLDRPLIDNEIRPYWHQLIEVNRDRLVDPDNPDLILPGQTFQLPPIEGHDETPTAASPSSPASDGDADGTDHAVDEAPPAGESTAPSPTAVGSKSSADVPSTTPHPDPSATSLDPDADDTDEDSDLSVPATALLGVAATGIAVGVAHSLRRRHHRRLQQLDHRTAPPPPAPRLDDIRRELVLADDPAHLRALHTAVAELARVLTAGASERCRPRLAQASPERIEVLLSEATLPTPPGWRPEASGTVWTRELTPAESSDHEELPSSPAPCLVSLGRPETSGQVHLDLEAEGVLAVTGEPTARSDLLRSLILELAHNPFGPISLVTVGDIAPALHEHDHVRAARTWEEIADDALSWARSSRDLLAANQWPDTLRARTHAPDHDGLTPLVVICDAPPETASFEEFRDLAAQPTTAVTLIITGAHDPEATSIVVSDEELSIPELGLTCRRQGVTEQAAHQMTEVLDSADQMPDPDPHPTPEHTSNGAPDPSPTPAPFDHASTYEDPDYDILVRLLGDIDVVGGHAPLRPKQTAVVAYLALHAPVTSEQVEDAVWSAPSKSRHKQLANTMSQCRTALGSHHFPVAVDSRYTVSAGVRTDIELFRRRVDYAATQPPQRAIPVLRGALELVRGPVFSYAKRNRHSYIWVDLENWHTTWELEVTEAAEQLAELYLETEDPDDAVWAAERGLVASPTHPGLTELLMRAHAARGDRIAAHNVYEHHVTALERLDIDDVADSTVDLHDQLCGCQRPNAAAG